MDVKTFNGSVACVIVTYNGARWLLKCLASLKSGAVTPFIIVVDNASQDSTANIAASDDAVELIQLDRNYGFGHANNVGIARSLARGAQSVLLLNQDAYLSPDTLMCLLTVPQDARTGIICPMQFSAEERLLDEIFMQHYLAQFSPELLSDALLGKELKQQYAIEAAPAAAWLLTREFLESVGGFDPLFFMYCEDDDLCARAKYHGYQVQIVPRARFYHSRGFHGEADQMALAQRIRRKTIRLKSKLILGMKQLDGSFWKNIWKAYVDCGLTGAGALLRNLDGTQACAALLAMLACLPAIPAIYRHRQRCKTKGAHWLEVRNVSEVRT
jgi:GT2 family glycosyltransferase